MSLFVVTSHLHLFQVPDQYGTIRAVAEGRAEQFLVGTSRNFILRGTFNDGFQIEVQVSCGMPTFSSLFLDNMLWFLQGGFFRFQGHTDELWGLATHPFKDLLLTCAQDRQVCMWNSVEHRLEWTRLVDVSAKLPRADSSQWCSMKHSFNVCLQFGRRVESKAFVWPPSSVNPHSEAGVGCFPLSFSSKLTKTLYICGTLIMKCLGLCGFTVGVSKCCSRVYCLPCRSPCISHYCMHILPFLPQKKCSL